MKVSIKNVSIPFFLCIYLKEYKGKNFNCLYSKYDQNSKSLRLSHTAPDIQEFSIKSSETYRNIHHIIRNIPVIGTV